MANLSTLITSALTGPVGATGPTKTTINATDDTTTTTLYPVMVGAAGSEQTANVTTTKLTFNASTGTLNSTIFNTTSDEIFKENINTLKDSLAKVLSMRGVSFNWKDNKNKAIGVIAQELLKIAPEIVNKDEKGHLSVSYDSIIGFLIEAIKEQQKQIDQIKNSIDGEKK